MHRRWILVAIAAVACAPDVVTWEEPREIPGAPSADARLALSAGTPLLVPATLSVAAFDPPGACAGSLHLARGSGSELHAVWWSLRADSTAALLASRSTNEGASWTPPVPVDTTDVGGFGCARYPPAIAVDSLTGYVHIVYSLTNQAGAGVFVAHSMEHGAMYHAPVVVVYGDHLSAADVAAERSRVVVAYEDPNLRAQSAGKIALAISQTDGHIFDIRVPVTGGSAAVANPRVALSGNRVAVAWIESARLIAGSQRRMVRVGRLK